MSKKKLPTKKAPAPASAVSAVQARAARAAAGFLSPKWIRETVETLVVAFVLAFLFRTFAAEAFVIPTGSMAPTLMGQHKDVLCRICGYRYQAGASSESEDLAR